MKGDNNEQYKQKKVLKQAKKGNRPREIKLSKGESDLCIFFSVPGWEFVPRQAKKKRVNTVDTIKTLETNKSGKQQAALLCCVHEDWCPCIA